jgi:imidazolonepropionase-like amidohydrolase
VSLILVVVVLLTMQECPAQTDAGAAEGIDAHVIAFVDVTVVSMRDEAALPGQTVLVEGERISAVGAADAIAVPTGATVIDGSGRCLIPGLADMHVHVNVPFADGPLYLAAGITTVLSMGTRSPGHEATIQEQQRSRTPGFVGPTLHSVGPLFLGGETPQDAERIVHATVEHGYDLVKVYRDVSPETYARIHDTARSLGIRVTGHAQRTKGMHPVYDHQQDLAHVEEYLYAAFNPVTTGFRRAVLASVVVLFVLLMTHVGWGLGALRRRVGRGGAKPARRPRSVRKWTSIFTGMSWLYFIGLALTVTEPVPGVYAGGTVAAAIVGALMLLVVSVAVVLTFRIGSAWREVERPVWRRAALLLLVGLVATFVVSAACLTPRAWRTTQTGLERIARESAAAGIWVTTTLVVPDYVRRQAGDEFFTLIQRPEMRYLTPATRDQWINNNRFRPPPPMAPLQSAIWSSWTELLSRLTRELHEANVPLLAGSDAGGPPGVLPGFSLHEELRLLVEAGLTPYAALRTATVNAAAYLDAGQEFGMVAEGHRADLVLLTGNPLDDIGHIRSRVGVMKRGRWFTSDELDAALELLAEQRR